MKRLLCTVALVCACLAFASVTDLSKNGYSVTVETKSDKIDPSKDFYITLRIKAPDSREIKVSDLREKFKGFAVAEEYSEPQVQDDEGKTVLVSNWRLVPKVDAKRFLISPFVIDDFYTSPVVFAPPDARTPVTGDMEIRADYAFPGLSWKLVGEVALGLLILAALVYGIVRLCKYLGRRVREHRMSPIERARLELERLFKKGLPGRGLYKDFYVELTMVVRRYIERQHGVKAPRLTTDEFLKAAQESPAFNGETLRELRSFLESADMVKFAGVDATPEMADDASSSAKKYLETDSVQIGSNRNDKTEK